MYTLINNFTGSTHGMWSDPYSAESFKFTLDDWMYWTVVKFDEI